MRLQRFNLRLGLFTIIWTLGVLVIAAQAQAKPPVNPKFERFFWYYVDKRSLPERALNSVDITLQDAGRSFALLIGVYKYPKIGEYLAPAHTDITKLTNYLKTQEFFDEIVVLTNEDFNFENLNYIMYPKIWTTP